MTFNRRRIRLLLKRPTEHPADWTQSAREKAIKLADVIKWRTVSHPIDGEAILIEVACEEEATALRGAFPAIETLPPAEAGSDPKCLVVFHPRNDTPKDQLLARMERFGKVLNHKALPMKASVPKSRPALILFEFEDPSVAQSVIDGQFIIVKGDRLLCRTFFVGERPSTMETEKPEKVHAWLFGIPRSFRDIDTAAFASTHKATSWVMRRAPSGDFAVQLEFETAEDRDIAVSGTPIIEGKRLTWLLAPPCLRCGHTGHMIKDCTVTPPSHPTTSPANGPSSKRPRNFREAAGAEAIDIGELVRTEVEKATKHLLEALQQRDQLIAELIQRMGLNIDLPTPAPQLTHATVAPAAEETQTNAENVNAETLQETTTEEENTMDVDQTQPQPAEAASQKRGAAAKALETIAKVSSGKSLRH